MPAGYHRRMPFQYPEAGLRAQPEVKAAIRRWRHSVGQGIKQDMPLLYWLLGSGTPPYKMSKRDSHYGPPPHYVSRQRCDNCTFAYVGVTTERFICSQIEGTIEPKLWCRLWRP
jgi:hypothetical protein